MEKLISFETKKNTFVFPHKSSSSELDIERRALTEALNENLGIIYSTSTTDSKVLDSIKNQCEEAGRKVFLVSFTEPSLHYGLNPFLNLKPTENAQLYFSPDSKEHELLTAVFENQTGPITPDVVLKIVHQNHTLFKSFFEPLLQNINAIISSINPFSNIDKDRNVDLSSIINEGHVLILGGLNDTDPLLAEQIKTFINDYLIKPLFLNNQINFDRSTRTYTITSSESAIDPTFTEKVFAYGSQLNMQGLYTERRTKRSEYESMHLIYANSHNKIKGDSPKLDLFLGEMGLPV